MAVIGVVVPLAARRAAGAVARVQVAARSDLAAALVDSVQGLLVVALGCEPAFLAASTRSPRTLRGRPIPGIALIAACPPR
jgi:hypothetical protein